MSDTFEWDVFLSHSSVDKPRVARLAERLEDAGLKVWFDRQDIDDGQDIVAAIEDGLERSRVLILCMTKSALESEWVRVERNTATFRDPANAERRFLPLLFEDCTVPAMLRRIKYIDWRSESDESWQQLTTRLTLGAAPLPDAPKEVTGRECSLEKPTGPGSRGTAPVANPDEAANQLSEWATAHFCHGLKPVLIVDESERLIQTFDHRFFNRIRGMVDRLMIVLCSRCELDQVKESNGQSSPFSNTLQLERVTLFELSAVEEAVTWFWAFCSQKISQLFASGHLNQVFSVDLAWRLSVPTF